MKLTLSNLNNIKKQTSNKLTKHVCNYVISHWQDYGNKKDIFTDVLYHGCQSGIVGELIYYSDSMAFYKKYNKEINELLSELMVNIGTYDMIRLFGKKWDETDPLAKDCTNQNLLAWFGFEESLRNLGLQFEDLQNDI